MVDNIQTESGSTTSYTIESIINACPKACEWRSGNIMSTCYATERRK